jgi:signal transduction histidine kinase
MRRAWRWASGVLGRSITARITAGFVCAMAVLLALTAIVVYKRMESKLGGDELEDLLAGLVLAYGGALVISGFVGYRVARAALDPVEEMRRRAASGTQDATVRLEVPPTDDELSRLARTLNALLDRIQAGVAREHQLIADASHELRTPLGLMLMQIDLALSRERSPAETRLALERLRGETRRLVRLANDLLLLARADEGQLPTRIEPVPIAGALAQASERFAERPGAVVVHAGPASDVVLADRDRLAQALDNLIDNALRHGRAPVELEAVAGDGEVVVHVRDHGTGFAAEVDGRAFDRFVTGAQGRTGTSTGLGLTIVAAIAAALGGRVGVQRAPGGGADVWLALPSSPVQEGH